ncbi:hypothetical protein [uncultured Nocardioides sp.]|uniref:hypothetical protein n=1 Tax=uncultured Nocardioides sp. TaxID=198441 RepID=UPI0030F841CF
MSEHRAPQGLTDEELAAETGTALPDKEVVSILDLNADLDLAIDAAAPIDLGVAANANVAAPIDAAVGANVLSEGSTAQAMADQGAVINQNVEADAIANATQDSTMEQGASPDASASNDPVTTATGDPTGQESTTPTAPDAVGDTSGVTDGATDGATDGLGDTVDGAVGDAGGAVGDAGGAVGGVTSGAPSVGDLADGNLLDVNVDLAADANLAAPINGAVAANANVAAPIDAAVAANVGSVDSEAVALAQQDAVINQNIEGAAEATSDQSSDISQP